MKLAPSPRQAKRDGILTDYEEAMTDAKADLDEALAGLDHEGEMACAA